MNHAKKAVWNYLAVDQLNSIILQYQKEHETAWKEYA